MNNGIPSINPGTPPLALSGARNHANLPGWLPVRVPLPEAMAPTQTVPFVHALPALKILLLFAGRVYRPAMSAATAAIR